MTTTRWKVTGKQGWCNIETEDGKTLLTLTTDELAHKIVREHNAHAAMVEALTVASDGINTYFDCRSEWTPKQMREQLESIQNICEAALRPAKGG